MKIRSLLLAGLLVGQVVPVTAMGNFITNAAKQATIVAGSVMAASMFVKVAEKHPYLVAGFLGGSIGSLYLGMRIMDRYHQNIQNKINDIHFKIGCCWGIISPDQHLLSAVRKQNLKEAELALDRGADCNLCAGCYEKSPLSIAVFCNNENMVDLLLSHNVDVNKHNVLEEAIRGRTNTNALNKEIAKKLVLAGADRNARVEGLNMTIQQFAQAQAALTGNQDYINIFKPETKLL